MFKKKTVAILTAFALLSGHASASVQSEMQSWFDDIGAYGNVTGPQVVKGQTGTTFTGGSFYMRTPVRQYSLFNITPPTLRGGCGGIDAHMGAFSFINSEQLTAMLRNIGNAAIGTAFQMAVDAVSPELGGILKSMMEFAQSANNALGNTCGMGKMIAETAMNSAPVKKAMEEVFNTGEAAKKTNLFTDSLNAAKSFVDDATKRLNSLDQMKKADPGLKDILESKNAAWYALRQTNIPDDMVMLMMSMTGTVINLGSDKAPDKEPSINVVQGSISFEELVGKPGVESFTAKMLRCTDSDTTKYGCLSVTPTDTTVYSFYGRVKKLLAKGSSNIVNRQANTFNDQIEAALYQNSELPIWRIVQGSVYTGASQAFDDSYAKVIATQLAYSYMTNMIREINKALANSKASRDEANVKATEELIARLKSMTERANEMMMIAYTEAQSVAKMQQSVAQLFDHLRQSTPIEISRSMKVFSN